ncbi:hypothetical protein C8F01DRAFT_1332160 [Mycena amicta]|nr:hypothetical protein C8F01DRAFT_1332160 [Mycena amicta]
MFGILNLLLNGGKNINVVYEAKEREFETLSELQRNISPSSHKHGSDLDEMLNPMIKLERAEHDLKVALRTVVSDSPRLKVVVATLLEQRPGTQIAVYRILGSLGIPVAQVDDNVFQKVADLLASDNAEEKPNADSVPLPTQSANTRASEPAPEPAPAPAPSQTPTSAAPTPVQPTPQSTEQFPTQPSATQPTTSHWGQRPIYHSGKC